MKLSIVKILNLSIVFFMAALLQGCMPPGQILYIPPANSQMPKAQLIHVSRLHSSSLSMKIVKIDGITVLEGTLDFQRPYDFYLLPGTYAIELRYGDKTTAVVSPADAGRTMVDSEFLIATDAGLPKQSTPPIIVRQGVFMDGGGEIHVAAQRGDVEKVKALLKGNPNLVFSQDNKGDTALHWAASNDHKEVAELLIASKADVNARDNKGWTPLHAAAIQGYKDMAEFLLASQADVNARDNNGSTPLQEATAKGHADVAELLRQHGGHK
jgi:hypothetical protein